MQIVAWLQGDYKEKETGWHLLLPSMLLSLQVANLNANSEKEKLQYSRCIAKKIFKIADQTAEEVLGSLILHR